MAEERKIDEVAGALASSSLTSTTQTEQRPTTLDDLPNDVLVSIFSIIDDEVDRVVRMTFPLVCRRWRDLYRSRAASPLHFRVHIDLRVDRAQGALAWARRLHAADVRSLWVHPLPPNARIRDFTEGTFAELVTILGPHFEAINITRGCGSLLRDRFVETLRDVVFPAGRMQELRLFALRAPLPNSFADALRRVSALTSLILVCDAAPTRSPTWGFSRFPDSITSLTGLEALYLFEHLRITSLPAGISRLTNLRDLTVRNCTLRSVPAELGKLSSLTNLDVGGNPGLGDGPEATAFPPELRGLSLRKLCLAACNLRAVPSFVGSLKTLEEIDISKNDDLQVERSLVRLVERLPRLRVLRVGKRVQNWTQDSATNLVALGARLHERNPDAPRLLFEVRQSGEFWAYLSRLHASL